MDAGANELKTLDELRHDMLNIMANCSYQKIQKYKAFIEQNDQRIGQMVKQITKLVELFREFRRFFQNKREIGESISEPIRNISALAQNMELNVMLEKFADLNKILFENSNNFLEKFLEITLSPLDQLIKSFNSAEIEICKKNVDKAFRAYEAKL
ncbi:hypothetical protein BpHYR1_046357 [Brachionus plicatilis]|uniref:Uncharacterized protein n=1 Tax=Brachionus plicatilis TaxID=10195 RepID=A0A3M7RGY6_BRAPC|nr:hypothetical protein BpHYR1_046357 [Brachionus plicatilis]